MQNGFVRENSAHVVPVIADLVQRWQSAGGDTIFTRFFNRTGSPYERLIHWSQMMNPPQTDIVDELAPYASKATAVIDKPGYTLFSPRGAQVIADGGWRDLIICGLATESCVCKTAVDTFERNLIPWVLTDACASHAGNHAHQAGLLVIERFIGAGQLLTTSQVPPLVPRLHRLP
jgi:nicotinamidase-related amidase